jgi:hypothetical protein
MASRAAPRRAKPKRPARAPARLLSGGNPQIAKASGDAPVQAYLDALPGWKRATGRWIDAVIVRAVPHVQKAVKWNSPLYGVDGESWFLSVHAFTSFVRVAFFQGTSLEPLPPGASTVRGLRYVDLHEDDALDESRLAAWVKQAAALPGWRTPAPKRT